MLMSSLIETKCITKTVQKICTIISGQDQVERAKGRKICFEKEKCFVIKMENKAFYEKQVLVVSNFFSSNSNAKTMGLILKLI